MSKSRVIDTTHAGDHEMDPNELDFTAPSRHFFPPSGVVVMIGASGSGKSTWAHRAFPGINPLSSDHVRVLITDDADNQACSPAAFRLLGEIARARLEYGRLAVIDATNTLPDARAQWLELARELGVPCAALWIDVPHDECMRRQEGRERKVPERVVTRQHEALANVRQELEDEGFDCVMRIDEGANLEVVRPWTPPDSQPLGTHGALHRSAAVDVVGDVHGCPDELRALMRALGWSDEGGRWEHPEGRLLVFVGDLTDRGPKNLEALELALDLVEDGRAALVMGNHDDKLRRYLLGNTINLDEHIQTTTRELDALPDEERVALTARALAVYDASPLWARFCPTPDEPRGTLVVSHAAWKPSIAHAKRDKARWYCLYGPSTGEVDEFGFPERLDWRKRYPAHGPTCVTGHTPFFGEPDPSSRTICIDTACVFGGRLTALRWPERELVSVDAERTYSEHPAIGEQPRYADS